MPEPPRPDEPVRVGIVSGFFLQHSNWKIPIKGWLSQLDRRRFRIFGYHTGTQYDGQTEAASGLCERFVQGPLSLDGWRNTILADRPHVLIYPEVGMNPVAARLAAQRLARVQCNSWGHPDTSGFPTLDYYLSSDLMEPPGGQEHYTEQLVRLPNLSIYYEPLDVAPAKVGRTELGFRAGATVFWCGQSLYKYLPQYDGVFGRIALAAPDCQFAFIQHPKGTNVTELFRRRLDRAFTAVGLSAEDHCVFLPRLDHAKFVAAIGQADIFLDSIGWSGCNSTLESLPHDLPVVTMAGDLMRGRHGAAILAMMGVTQTVAETVDGYVSIAVRLARDIEWRMAIKRRITAAKHHVYRDRSCISALEKFLIRVVRAPGCEAPRSSER
jgi:predicted O-linked N-acetylglucosamine transferase (SPINDLY family)